MPIIKNIVLSGGGVVLINQIGILKTLTESGFYDINNIEKIFSTSAGCWAATLLTLKIDWDTIIKYVIERPWSDVIKLKPENIINIYGKKGLFDKDVLDIFFKPLFNSINLSLDITMKEYFEYNNVELHFFTFEINNFELIDLNYKSHPNLKLLDAIYMSSSIPLLFIPICKENKCYIDGGVVLNYSLCYCLDCGCNEDETLAINVSNENGIVNGNVNGNENNVNGNVNGDELNIINDNTNMNDYISIFIKKLVNNLQKDNGKTIAIKNEIICFCPKTNLDTLLTVLDDKEFRNKLYEDGIEIAKDFLLTVKINNGI